MPASGCEPKSAIQVAPSTDPALATRTTDGELQPIATAAPAHVVKAMVNQEQPPPRSGIRLIGQAADPSTGRQAWTLVLNLPDPPTRGFNAADADRFARIAAIAMPHGVDQGLLKPQLKTGLKLVAAHRLQQQVQQWSQLKR